MVDEPASLLREIQAARFSPVRLREGYDMGDVDNFLDDLAGAIGQGADVGALVDNARFATVKLREGYDMGEVDRFLEQVRVTSVGHGTATSASAGGGESQAGRSATHVVSRDGQSGTNHPNVIQEQRGILSRLFGRR
jgi:DivIVA domain-containing protein